MRGGLTDAGSIPAASTKLLHYVVQYCPENGLNKPFVLIQDSILVQSHLVESDGNFVGNFYSPSSLSTLKLGSKGSIRVLDPLPNVGVGSLEDTRTTPTPQNRGGGTLIMGTASEIFAGFSVYETKSPAEAGQ